jgi:16S rRNA (cytosine967-C5)-methyltransferase
MPVSSARAAAFDILLRVDQQGAYASDLLHSEQFSKLSAADHGLATQLTLGVLRWRSSLDAVLSSISSQKLERLDLEVLIALRLALFQMRYLERIPARAAIFESVELVKRARKRSAAPFVNALLRKAQALPAAPAIADAQDAAALATSAAHPPWLVERWVKHYGFERARAICTHNQTIPTTTIHLWDQNAEAELLQAGITLEPGALIASARRVVTGDVTKTSVYTSQRITIQDEASQLVAMLLGSGSTILDCCAAPGGKTRLIAERNPNARLIAMDLHPHRAALLRRLARASNVNVVVADARQLPLRAQFDRILADVPCSGTGTLAHNPEIKWRLKPEDLTELARRQLAILEAALAQLSSGGRALYSTCSLEPEENEGVIEALRAKGANFQVVDCRSELARLRNAGDLAAQDLDALVSENYLRTVPGVHPCDGFFTAILART